MFLTIEEMNKMLIDADKSIEMSRDEYNKTYKEVTSSPQSVIDEVEEWLEELSLTDKQHALLSYLLSKYVGYVYKGY